MSLFSFDEKKEFNVICMGRVGVDLYANQKETDFEDVTSFEKQIGGSSGNIAIGLARAGLNVSFIGKVANDMTGKFVYQILKKEKIDHKYLTFSPDDTRTSLALCEVKKDNCNVVIYRNEAADLYLQPEDIDENHIQNSNILLFTGTGLCKEPSFASHRKAVESARHNGIYIIFDLDYRAYSWNNREHTKKVYQTFCDMSDMIVANKLEFEILLENRKDDLNEIAKYYTKKNKTVILKDGEKGSTTYLPNGEVIFTPIYKVNSIKPYGSGDAFLANVIASLFRKNDIRLSLKYGTAAAAFVVQRQGCAFSMPYKEQLDLFIEEFQS